MFFFHRNFHVNLYLQPFTVAGLTVLNELFTTNSGSEKSLAENSDGTA